MSSLAFVLSALFLTAVPSPQAVQEKERGDRLAANGDLVAAAEAYENAEKLSPGFAEAINQLGFLMARQNRLDEAAAHFAKAIEADPGFALAHFNHGFVLRKQGRHAEAVEAFKSYVGLAPEDAAGFYNLAESYKGIGDSANALSSFERYIATEKDANKQARVEKARAAVEQLRRELAASAPASAAQADQPSAPEVSLEPAPVAPAATQQAAAVVAEESTRDTPAAAVSGTQTAATVTAPAQAAQPSAQGATVAPVFSVAIAPERVARARQKVAEGLQLRAEGKKRESLFAFQDAANVDPSNAQAVFELGVAYAESYYFPQAVERWERVLGMNVDEAIKTSARENIEKARKLIGGSSSSAPATAAARPAGRPASQPAAQPADESQPEAQPLALTAEAHDAYVRGSELYGRQLYVEAIRQFDAAIASMPSFSQAYAARGSAWFAQREFSRALADYSQAMRLDPALASPVLGVAETLNALGRKADAIPYYQAYIASRASDVQPSLQDVARQRLAEIGL